MEDQHSNKDIYNDLSLFDGSSYTSIGKALRTSI